MSDHDFEKQVQQKMEQLRLRPSDAVWTKVDKRIRKERRRRRVVLWLPLFLLCVVAGGYFFFENRSDNKFTASEQNSTQNNPDHSGTTSSHSQNTENDNASSRPVTGPATPANDAGAAKTTDPDQPVSNSNPNAGQIEPALPAQALPAKGKQGEGAMPAYNGTQSPAATNGGAKPKSELAAVPTDHQNKAVPSNNKTGARKNRNDRPRATIIDDHSVAAYDPNARPSRSSSGRKPVKNNGQQDQSVPPTMNGNDPVQAAAGTDTAQGLVVKPFREEKETTDPASATAQPLLPKATDSLKSSFAKNNPGKKMEPTVTPKRKRSGWSYGIVAEGGASHISKGSPFSLLSKKNNEPEDLAYASPAPPSQSFVSGPAGFTQVPDSKPAELKSSLAWSAGGFVQKELNKRISLSAGVQYSYFSMKMQVGQYMMSPISVSNSNYDQVVSAYYQGRNASQIGGGLFTASFPRPPVYHDYTNKYHFLEIPVKIHWRVTNEEQLPIIVDGGLSVAKLIATNALHYDGSNDVYYKDYDYFNKVQAGITAGVNVALFSNSDHPLWIGPTIKYQLSNLITSDLSSGQHLWSFGLGAKFFLRK